MSIFSRILGRKNKESDPILFERSVIYEGHTISVIVTESRCSPNCYSGDRVYDVTWRAGNRACYTGYSAGSLEGGVASAIKAAKAHIDKINAEPGEIAAARERLNKMNL